MREVEDCPGHSQSGERRIDNGMVRIIAPGNP
jgi:hypothetical protein